MLDSAMLYSEHADLYCAVADDRDFEAEANEILKHLSSPGRFVELFAGPARHSISASSAVPVAAIDTSVEMRAQALDSGFSGQYLVGDCADLCHLLLPNDVVVIPRFSLGLLPPRKAVQLLHRIKLRLCGSGSVFVEMHQFDFVDSVTSGELPSLEILERQFEFAGSRWNCKWPSQMVVRSRSSMNYDFSVLFAKEDDSESLTFLSSEWLYDQRRTKALISASGFQIDEHASFSTASGRFMRLLPSSALAEIEVPYFEELRDIIDSGSLPSQALLRQVYNPL